MEGARRKPGRNGSAAARAGLWAAGLALIATLLIATAASSAGRLRRAPTAQPGSSCTHPIVATLKRGQAAAKYHEVIYVAPSHFIRGVVAAVRWDTYWPNQIVCSARIQLRNGSWVGPTRLLPYNTPTPVGGEYDETTNPRTQYRQVVVKLARSPVPMGASCDHPMTSRAGYSDEKDPRVVFRVNAPRAGMDEVAATIYDPNIVICRAVAEEISQQQKWGWEFIRSFPITIGKHGGASTPVPMPNAWNFLMVSVYSRYLHLPKRVR
jgi:hypothetical protein